MVEPLVVDLFAAAALATSSMGKPAVYTEQKERDCYNGKGGPLSNQPACKRQTAVAFDQRQQDEGRASHCQQPEVMPNPFQERRGSQSGINCGGGGIGWPGCEKQWMHQSSAAVYAASAHTHARLQGARGQTARPAAKVAAAAPHSFRQARLQGTPGVPNGEPGPRGGSISRPYASIRSIGVLPSNLWRFGSSVSSAILRS
jgi:hypothetical protein